MTALDIAQLIAEISATIPRVRSYIERRRVDPAAATMLDPYARHAWVSRRDTLEALREREHDLGPRILASWVHAFLFGRMLQDPEIAELSAREVPSLEVELPVPERISFREATRRLVTTRDRPVRDQVARALVKNAPSLAAETRELWSRRGEIASRLGLPFDGPIPLFTQGPNDLSVLEELARFTLRETHDLTSSLLHEVGPSWSDVIAIGAGLEADVGWPRQISTSVLREWFGGESGWLQLPPTMGALPRLLNGASFTRLLARFGARWADAAAPRSVPIALGSFPSARPRAWIGNLTAALLVDRVFLSKNVRFSRGEIERTRRSQSLITLFATRLSAARCLVRAAALSGDARALRQRATDVMCEALQRDVPAELASVLPRLTTNDLTRFISIGPAARLRRELRDAFDEDWFRNPRAVLELRDRLSRPAEPSEDKDTVLAGLRLHIENLHSELS